MQGTVYFQK